MINMLWAVVRDGKIELVEQATLQKGTRLLVTFLPEDEETRFWLDVSQPALDTIWNNNEDDVYAELLKA